MRIYLETLAKLYIQKLIYDGRLLLAILYISHHENGNSPFSKNKITIERFFEYTTTFVNIDRENIIEKKAVEMAFRANTDTKTGLVRVFSVYVPLTCSGNQPCLLQWR